MILTLARTSLGWWSSKWPMTCAKGLLLLGLQSFVKTSGGKGLHIVVPVEPAAWDQVKTFTKTVATDDGQRETRPLRRHNCKARTPRSQFESIICGTTAVPPRLQHIRRGRCRGRRFRHPSIGRSFHPDFVRTTSQSGNLLHRLSSLKPDPWQGIFKICQQLPQFHHIAPR